MKQKGFAPILILVGLFVIICVAGGVYYFGITQNNPLSQNQVVSQTPQPAPAVSSSPDETANWKIYTDQKYGFSFKYPSSWKPESREVSNPRYYGEHTLFLACSTSVFLAEVFDMAKYPSSYTDLESYLKIRGISTTPAKLQTGKNLTLGNEQAMYWEIPGDPGSSNPSARAILFSSIRKLIIDLNVFNYCGKNLQQISSVFNQILSTFKFLDQENSGETGPNTICQTDENCWCRAFTGAKFIPNQVVPSRCNLNTNHCVVCTYE